MKLSIKHPVRSSYIHIPSPYSTVHRSNRTNKSKCTARFIQQLQLSLHRQWPFGPRTKILTGSAPLSTMMYNYSTKHWVYKLCIIMSKAMLVLMMPPNVQSLAPHVLYAYAQPSPPCSLQQYTCYLTYYSYCSI